jgi:enoyl-CoA hydratase/carnithine racemase
VALVTLNRPEALNALNNDIIHEVNHAFKAFDSDDRIGAIVLTGSKKAFAGMMIENAPCKSNNNDVISRCGHQGNEG